MLTGVFSRRHDPSYLLNHKHSLFSSSYPATHVACIVGIVSGITGPLPLQWRQKRRPPWRKMLIDGVQHETYSEVVAHNLHDLDGMLTPEMVHHLLPEFTGDSVFAKQRAPETDHRRVFVG